LQTLESGNSDIEIVDAATGIFSRLTFNPGADGVPVWSPTGDRLYFNSSRESAIPFPNSLFERASSGAGQDQLLLKAPPEELYGPQDSSPPDGAYLAFFKAPLAQIAKAELWVLPIRGDKKPFRIVEASKGTAGAARFSPDGRWISYTTDDTGTNRIVVRPFPDVNKGTWQVPGAVGAESVWRRDGRELFYLGPDRTMMAVPVTLGETPQFGQPVALFKTGLPPQTIPPQFFYDVSADGQHFLINLAPSSAVAQAAVPPPMTVVVNWTSLLIK
jgi:Tol biopolymer transport system component